MKEDIFLISLSWMIGFNYPKKIKLSKIPYFLDVFIKKILGQLPKR